MKLSCETILGSLALWLLAAVAQGADQDPVDFMREVRPILAQTCFTCHGPDEGTREAGLRLDHQAAALAEMDSGDYAIVPGDPDQSALFQRIATDDPDLRMPPGDVGTGLSAEQIDTLRRWIEQGAEYEDHWAFQPPQPPPLPAVTDTAWPRGAIDHFVLAELERQGIGPSPEADRPTLIRRLSLDLLGLPPTPEQVARFVHDDAPLAYERLVERTLASPRFGERWGKHWLDLARYADSDGYLGDTLRPHAYLYRDWVIDAINRDLPLDQFTIEQIAGDLLPEATLQQKIATGFHRNAMKNTEAGADREEDRVNRMVNYVSTTGTVFLGLTVGCAECHTHKFDPISHEEFFQLYAFFNNTAELDVPVEQAATADLKAPTLTELDESQRRVTRIHLRGDFRSPGDAVQPGTPAALHPLRPRGERPDRLDLAHWLVDPANALMHRTTVNHFWKHLFGRGLVNTPDNFGTTGESPSHPELLDWLALELVKQGWSRKAIVRQIVLSATYRQSSQLRPELLQRDPYNVWLARQSRFRLEAEVVRDAALAASNLLHDPIGGPSIRPPLDARVTAYSRNKDWPVSPGAEQYRRGMYILFRRSTPFTMLVTFDAPDTSVACTQRERSNSPLQALTLLNDPTFFECAQQLARHSDWSTTDPRQWIAQCFERCLARSPREAELERLVELYQQQAALLAELSSDELTALVGEPAPGVDLRAQAARVAVARTLINVNEFITRE